MLGVHCALCGRDRQASQVYEMASMQCSVPQAFATYTAASSSVSSATSGYCVCCEGIVVWETAWVPSQLQCTCIPHYEADSCSLAL